jgi:hypothetical protein
MAQSCQGTELALGLLTEGNSSGAVKKENLAELKSQEQ